MPYYYVRHLDGPQEEYRCGPELDAEGAIIRFNATDGTKIGRVFTTLETVASFGDYQLIEQQRGVSGMLEETRLIPLYDRLQ